jgi:hypothetical protein
MTLQIYYIRFIITFNKFILGICILFSKYFFINRDFGLFILQIHKAWDMLLNNPVVIVYFFILGTE